MPALRVLEFRVPADVLVSMRVPASESEPSIADATPVVAETRSVVATSVEFRSGRSNAERRRFLGFARRRRVAKLSLCSVRSRRIVLPEQGEHCLWLLESENQVGIFDPILSTTRQEDDRTVRAAPIVSERSIHHGVVHPAE